MKHLLTTLPIRSTLLALISVALVGCGSPPTRVATANSRPVFPLMAWDDLPDAKTAAGMRDCGITCVAFVRPSMLDVCRDHGLQAIIFDETVSGTNWTLPFDGETARKNLPALLAKIGGHPAVMGYHLRDEPGPGEFPELAKAVAAVKELAPGKWAYINLNPGDGDAYTKYVEDFIEICKPTVISYDRYGLVNEDDFNPVIWSNLAHIRSIALKHGLPYWNIVLTSPHWSYREITEADIRLQNWGSLAYGVSGLAFYKFCSKELSVLDAPDLGNFRNGPLDQFAEKTQTWYWLRNCNHQIQNIAPFYLKLRSDSVYHFGSVPALNSGSGETNLVKDLPNTDTVVGDFTHEDGSRYVMIVNKNRKASIPCVPQFNHKPSAVQYVCPRTGELRPFLPQYYWLAPGQGVLLKLS